MKKEIKVEGPTTEVKETEKKSTQVIGRSTKSVDSVSLDEVKKELAESIAEVHALQEDMEDIDADADVPADAIKDVVEESIQEAVTERDTLKDSFDTLEEDDMDIEHEEDINRVDKLKELSDRAKEKVKAAVEFTKPVVDKAIKDTKSFVDENAPKVKSFVDENAPKIKEGVHQLVEKAEEGAATLKEKFAKDKDMDEDVNEDEFDGYGEDSPFADSDEGDDESFDEDECGCIQGKSGNCPLGHNCYDCDEFDYCYHPFDGECEGTCTGCEHGMQDTLEDKIEAAGEALIKHKKLIATCIVGTGLFIGTVLVGKALKKR